MTRILAINGSYRDDGVTDSMVNTMVESLTEAGAEVEVVSLRDYPIEFCLNCRECTQEPGDAPGTCVQQDGMHALVEKIEKADAFILASPTNFYTVTALFKRFMERLIVYAYWPWDMNTPRLRKAGAPKKKAVLVSSCAAPAFLGRLFYASRKQLKMAATTIGAETVGTVFTGLVAATPRPVLGESARKRARAAAARLLP